MTTTTAKEVKKRMALAWSTWRIDWRKMATWLLETLPPVSSVARAQGTSQSSTSLERFSNAIPIGS